MSRRAWGDGVEEEGDMEARIGVGGLGKRGVEGGRLRRGEMLGAEG